MSISQASPKSKLEIPNFKDKYDNYIGGEWTAPVKGQYFDNISPVDGNSFTKVARSTEDDINKAIDAAWKPAPEWMIILQSR